MKKKEKMTKFGLMGIRSTTKPLQRSGHCSMESPKCCLKKVTWRVGVREDSWISRYLQTTTTHAMFNYVGGSEVKTKLQDTIERSLSKFHCTLTF